MAKNKQRSIYLEDKIWDKAKEKADSMGMSISLVIKWLVLRWLKGELEAIPQTQDDLD